MDHWKLPILALWLTDEVGNLDLGQGSWNTEILENYCLEQRLDFVDLRLCSCGYG